MSDGASGDVEEARREIARLADNRGKAAAESLALLSTIAVRYRCLWLFSLKMPSEAELASRAVTQACADFRAGVRVRGDR